MAPAASKVFDNTAVTLLVTLRERDALVTEQLVVAERADPTDGVIAELKRRGVISILVEGGAQLLSHFIRRGLWDEARVITGEVLFGRGTPAPHFDRVPLRTERPTTDRIDLFVNGAAPDPHWPW